jgi:hypothetical protein
MHTRFLVHFLMLYLLSSIVMSGCGATRDVKRRIPPDLISREIRLGISPEEARAFMVDNGFECSLVQNGTFTEYAALPDGRYEEVTHDDIKFIHCVKTGDDSFSRPVRADWKVAIVLNENDKVEAVLSRRDLTGP